MASAIVEETLEKFEKMTVLELSEFKKAFEDASWALLVGSVPRKAGMERGDLLSINGGIFALPTTRSTNDTFPSWLKTGVPISSKRRELS